MERRNSVLAVRIVRSPVHEQADAPHAIGLLRGRRERPHRCAAEQRDERAPLHSITSSARSRIDSGILTLSALAAVWLMTSSNLVGAWTGSSPGFLPRRIRST